MLRRGCTGGARRDRVSRGWGVVGALSISETVSWGILYYAFAVLLVPMQAEVGLSTAQLTGAFSLALVVSAASGILVGRYLDRHPPRALMTAGSIGGVLLVVAWSRIDSVAALYVVWAGIGVVMATVLYEPAFTVLAKRFRDPGERRRAMTTLTLVGALASFIFLPLTQALIDSYGWRDAVLVLAAMLAAITVPLHLFCLQGAPRREASARRADSRSTFPAEKSTSAGGALRSASFWLLSSAFFLATLTTVAMMVHSILILLERGNDFAFAAFAVGLGGVSQIPGRLLFGTIAARSPRWIATATPFALIGLGIATVAALQGRAAIVIGLVLLGAGNGMTTLARATAIADLYGAGAYGTIAGVAGAMTKLARAAGPLAAALLAAVAGYTALLWTLVATAALATALAARAEVRAARAASEGATAPAPSPQRRREPRWLALGS